MHDGDPGKGKSLMYVTIAAHVTTGQPLPGNLSESLGGLGRRGVVLICAEDDWEDTILPRLIAADADLTKIATVLLERDAATKQVTPLEIPRDLQHIRSAIGRR